MTIPTATLTPAAYLGLERQQAGKHEYESEICIPMGGGTKAHNRIAGNLFGFIWTFLRAEAWDAQVYQADLRVFAPLRGNHSYPDIVVTLGEEQYLDRAADTLLNPSLIIEVLSDSTETRDRGIKFDAYRSIDSLKEYVLVAQDRPQVEGFHQNEQGEWVIREIVKGKAACFAFKTLPLELDLEDIYARVGLPG
jgi:Uma2 family endonuclease